MVWDPPGKLSSVCLGVLGGGRRAKRKSLVEFQSSGSYCGKELFFGNSRVELEISSAGEDHIYILVFGILCHKMRRCMYISANDRTAI